MGQAPAIPAVNECRLPSPLGEVRGVKPDRRVHAGWERSAGGMTLAELMGALRAWQEKRRKGNLLEEEGSVTTSCGLMHPQRLEG